MKKRIIIEIIIVTIMICFIKTNMAAADESKHIKLQTV
ncbi:peptidoglycan hydrolase CwlO-like protein [Anaerotaenia torta]